MTYTSKNSGNALLLVLGIVLLAALGIGGWLYMKKSNPADVGNQAQIDAPASPEGTAPTSPEQTSDATVPEPSQTTPADTTGNTSGSAATTTDAPASATSSSENVSIDVGQATGVRAIGNPNAPIKIVEYASLTCSHCAHFHNDVLPEMKTKYVETGKVYVEFIEFPLNDPALKAALTARCLPADKYEGFVNLLFKTQDHWAGGLDYMASLRQNAKLAGMSDATFDACQNNNELKQFVAKNMQTAQDKWKISATPTFIINDGAETISGAQPIGEFERVFRKISGDKIGDAPKVE